MKAASIMSTLIGIGIGPAMSPAMAQSGAFTPTGSMTTSRQSHSATLLNNGKVLIAGGTAGGQIWASAELYDPSIGTFGATGGMTWPRYFHRATLLPNGKVLLTGGAAIATKDSILAAAELYDPSTGEFTSTNDMTAARAGHTSTLLNSGKVLITGGAGAGNFCCVLASAELFDPDTGTFTPTGSMNFARAFHTATLLAGGKVLIDDDGGTNYAELYDPATGAFSLTQSSAWAYLDPELYTESATLLPDGNVLAELADECETADYAEVYDTSTGYFTITGNVTPARGVSTATLLPDGTVLIAGGGSGAVVNGFTEPELYHPLTGVFNPTGPMDTPRISGDAATLLPDGTVLLSGGSGCCGGETVLATASLYHPAALIPAPVLLSLAGGTQGAILHGATQAAVSPAGPAVAGEALEIYGNGLMEGGDIPPQVVIGGKLAQVLFFGDAPGYPGLNQINVLMPAGVAPGPSVPVYLNYLSRPSNEVTLPVQ